MNEVKCNQCGKEIAITEEYTTIHTKEGNINTCGECMMLSLGSKDGLISLEEARNYEFLGGQLRDLIDNELQSLGKTPCLEAFWEFVVGCQAGDFEKAQKPLIEVFTSIGETDMTYREKELQLFLIRTARQLIVDIKKEGISILNREIEEPMNVWLLLDIPPSFRDMGISSRAFEEINADLDGYGCEIIHKTFASRMRLVVTKYLKEEGLHMRSKTVCGAFENKYLKEERPTYDKLTPSTLLSILNDVKGCEPELFEEYSLDFILDGKKVYFDGSIDESERLNLQIHLKEEDE